MSIMSTRLPERKLRPVNVLLIFRRCDICIYSRILTGSLWRSNGYMCAVWEGLTWETSLSGIYTSLNVCVIRMIWGDLSQCGVLTGWAASLLTLFGLVYGVLDAKMGIPGSAAYVSLGHTAWGLGLGWIVVACCSGYGGTSLNFLIQL